MILHNAMQISGPKTKLLCFADGRHAAYEIWPAIVFPRPHGISSFSFCQGIAILSYPTWDWLEKQYWHIFPWTFKGFDLVCRVLGQTKDLGNKLGSWETERKLESELEKEPQLN